jgi:hypothetical protein
VPFETSTIGESSRRKGGARLEEGGLRRTANQEDAGRRWDEEFGSRWRGLATDCGMETQSRRSRRKELLHSNPPGSAQLIGLLLSPCPPLFRFLPYLRLALTNLIKKYDPTYLYVSPSSSSASAATASSSTTSGLLTREFSIAFHNLPLTSGIRELRMEKIGHLMSISGTVTRTSEVRPELVFGSFVCETCRTTVNDVEQQFKYTEVSLFFRVSLYARLTIHS